MMHRDIQINHKYLSQMMDINSHNSFLALNEVDLENLQNEEPAQKSMPVKTCVLRFVYYISG